MESVADGFFVLKRGQNKFIIERNLKKLGDNERYPHCW